jgi:rod shape-determining protein MreC
VPYAGPSPAARGDVTGTLRLMAYLAVALVLVVLDHRGGWLHRARAQATVLVQPLWAIAGWPAQMTGRLAEDAGTLARLTEENRQLRRQALFDRARMARMQTVAADNARLRELLDAAQRNRLDAQLAPILDVDLDPTRQRLVLDAGTRDGVRAGQAVIDAGGLVGQVVQVTPLQATVLLVTDPDHAVPVSVARNGVRLVAYGRGRSDRLALENVPLSSDVKIGDVLVTSGLGGRFPPGFAVGTVTALQPDHSRAFLVGDVEPAAALDRGREVLLLRAGPRGADPVAVDAAAAAATETAATPSPPVTPLRPDAVPPRTGIAPVAPGAASPGASGPAAATNAPAAASDASRPSPTPTQASPVPATAAPTPAPPSATPAGAAPVPARASPASAKPQSAPPTDGGGR